MNASELNAYLDRIGYQGLTPPTVQTLTHIHQCQARSIAFENFDVLLKRPIDISAPAIWRKLVKQKRGGYCFELNGLMLHALLSYGFQARPLLARVHASGTLEARTHQLNLVEIDGENWLCDVGFGGQTLRQPLRFVLNQPQRQNDATFQLIEHPEYGYVLQTKMSSDWQDLYSFNLKHTFTCDLALGNYYTSTSPDSFFTNTACAAIQTETGTITLADAQLKKTIHGMETLTTLPSGNEYITALKKHFHIELDASFDDLNISFSNAA